MTVWQKQFFKEQLKEAERGVSTSKNGPKWAYIPSSPLPKIANCGEVCASQLVPLRHKPWEDDDECFLTDFTCQIFEFYKTFFHFLVQSKKKLNRNTNFH